MATGQRPGLPGERGFGNRTVSPVLPCPYLAQSQEGWKREEGAFFFFLPSMESQVVWRYER